VGVEVTHGFADDLGALDVGFAGTDAELAHGIEDAALRGLETVADIGQRARDDDGHRVFQERIGEFLGDVDRLDMFFGHGES
jgi:hypothetical protein